MTSYRMPQAADSTLSRHHDAMEMNMRSSRGLLVGTCTILMAVGAGAVSAQTPAASAQDCHRIVASAERLACYDAVSGRVADGPKEVEPAARPAEVARDADSPPRVGSPKLSMIDEAWGFDPSSPRYMLGFYRPTYLLFARYTDRVNNQPFTPIFQAAGVPEGLDDVEAKFQFSFKGRVWTTDDRRFGVWAAYTQQSHWQIFNDRDQVSRPFRETNYMPELFVSYRPGLTLPGGFQWTLLNAGFNHQSNGRSDPLSRSWNRLFAEFGFERQNFALSARVWHRIKEDAAQDDNPDITDYLGYGELNALYRWRDHTFTLSGRGNLSTSKGAGQFTWTSPRILGPFRGYVQVFSGYGESLIDYNWKQTTIGAGIALSSGL